MPFIVQDRREAIADGALVNFQPGDRCYVFYKEMVSRWRANPRWTTAHEIRLDMHKPQLVNVDDRIAEDLAWQVFFQLHVMPYEEKKRLENGDI
jgi:hypothetical protein